METNYKKYVIEKPKAEITPSAWTGGEAAIPGLSTRIAFLDNEVLPGAFYVECLWKWEASQEGYTTKPHTHDFDEVIAFFGTNPQDPFDLCGEVELWLEDEKLTITRSCLVFVPQGMKHCPLVFKRVDRPIFHFTTGPSKMYLGDKK
jgi:hypothetical protein